MTRVRTNPNGVVQFPRRPFPTHFYQTPTIKGIHECQLCGRWLQDGIHNQVRVLGGR